MDIGNGFVMRRRKRLHFLGTARRWLMNQSHRPVLHPSLVSYWLRVAATVTSGAHLNLAAEAFECEDDEGFPGIARHLSRFKTLRGLGSRFAPSLARNLGPTRVDAMADRWASFLHFGAFSPAFLSFFLSFRYLSGITREHSKIGVGMGTCGGFLPSFLSLSFRKLSSTRL